MSTSLIFRRGTFQVIIACITAIGLAGCQSNDIKTNDFKSKYKKIQDDMSEVEVDQLMDGYPIMRQDFKETETQIYSPICKRSPTFRKCYFEKAAANEDDHIIQIYFDEDSLVVHKSISEILK